MLSVAGMSGISGRLLLHIVGLEIHKKEYWDSVYGLLQYYKVIVSKPNNPHHLNDRPPLFFPPTPLLLKSLLFFPLPLSASNSDVGIPLVSR